MEAAVPALADMHFLLEGLAVSIAGFILSAFFYPDAYQFYFYYIAGLTIAAITIVLSASGSVPTRQVRGEAA